jgi:hypothetical protein
MDPFGGRGATDAGRHRDHRRSFVIGIASTDAIAERVSGGERHGGMNRDRVDD